MSHMASEKGTSGTEDILVSIVEKSWGDLFV